MLKVRDFAWIYALVALILIPSLTGCGQRTVPVTPKPPTTNPERDAGGGGASPDDTCLVAAQGQKRGAGQACVCDSDCSGGACRDRVCCEGPSCGGGGKRPEGAACRDGKECATGFCADGVCCNVACTGACLSCNQSESPGECLPVGAGLEDPHKICRKDAPESCGQSGVCNGQGGCAKYPADTVCGLGDCKNDSEFVPPSVCDGDGNCVAPGVTIPCNPSKCLDKQCVRVCASNDQCAAGKTCVAQSCGKFGNGQTCGKNEECDSGFCVDGVCCENACPGVCMTCSSAMKLGQCVPIAAGGSDPMCPTTSPSTCGTNGKCDGKGACSKYPNTTDCRGAKCDADANRMTLAAKCRDGVCPAVQTRSCAPYQGCNGNNCASSCTVDAQCAPGKVCNDDSCGAAENGAKCTRPSDCQSGFCAQGYCCESACGDVCKSCAIPGQRGQCVNVPAGGADPQGSCRDDDCRNSCNGAGACSLEPAGRLCGAEPTCSPDGVRTWRECTATGACEPKRETCAICSPTGCIASCEGQTDGTRCGGARVCCGGQCVNPATDVNNCRACGNRCAPSWTCGAMGCVCAAPRVRCGANCCPAGKVCGPNDACVDPTPVCAPPCGAGQTCTAQGCVCPGNQLKCGTSCCPRNNTCNGNLCVPPPVCDPQSCRACQRCGAGTSCVDNCNGHGTCPVGAAQCVCTGGWSGPNCQTPPPVMCNPQSCRACQRCGTGPTCVDNCNGHGTCPVGAAQCVCTGGWSGPNCQTPPPAMCNPQTCRACQRCGTGPTCVDNCNGHGTCPLGANRCACTGGWSGPNCQTPPPAMCTPQSCRPCEKCGPGGSCVDDCNGHGVCGPSGFRCICTDGWRGLKCQIPPGGNPGPGEPF